MTKMANFTQAMGKATKTVGKHAPLIFTIAGVVGLGATAVLSYKAAKKVEVIVDNMEKDMEDPAFELNKAEITKDVIGAVALPVVTGIVSITFISMSYYVLNRRVLGLSSALASVTGEHLRYRRRVAKEYGEEVEQRMSAPINNKQVIDDKGKVQDIEEKDDSETLHGRWFDQSSEYTPDDHSYNNAFIKSIDEKLQLKLFRRGYLLMNEMNDALGFPRTKSGTMIGWTTGTGFSLEPTNHRMKTTDGYVDNQIYLRWSAPKFIYDDIEYEDGFYRGQI